MDKRIKDGNFLKNPNTFENWFDAEPLVQRIKDSQTAFDSATLTAQRDDAGIVLARQFYYLTPKLLRVHYPDVTMAETGVNVDNSGGMAHVIQKLRVQAKGGFKEAGDAGSNKGQITLTGNVDSINVKKYSAESAWDEDEVAEAQLANRNLVEEYITAQNMFFMRENDEYFYNGVAGGKGLLNNAGFVSNSATGRASAFTTGDALFNEIAALIGDQRTAVNNIVAYQANVVVMPIDVINVAQRLNLNTAGGTTKVLQALKEAYPEVKFLSSSKCGIGSTSVTVAFNNSAESMSYRMPLPLTVGKIIATGSFNWNMQAKYRSAGLDIAENQSGRKLIGL